MQLNCQHVSASEAGDEIFQVLFAEKRDDELDGPYVLIQRAWLEEEGDAPSLIYVETHERRLVGHYPEIEAKLTRTHLTVQLPSPTNESIEIDFKASNKNFAEVSRMLGIILQKDMA